METPGALLLGGDRQRVLRGRGEAPLLLLVPVAGAGTLQPESSHGGA